MKQNIATIIPEEAVAIGGVLATILVALGIISNSQVPDVSQLIANVITGGLAIVAIYHLTMQVIANKHEKWMSQQTPQTPPFIQVDPANQP